MVNKVLETIKEYNMFQDKDKVIVAVSGGPDSMCLLYMLYKLKEKLNIELVAAHLNHCLRGKDADDDEQYVKEFCEKIGVEFYSKRVDINKISKEKNISCETAGREERYNFFYELKDKLNAQKIAVAHNANDQVETVFMRIMRGTGLSGLTGIKPIRDSIVVRPIIKLNRKEIELYCKDNHISTRIDKTNLENIYSRNKIRLELIPYIQKNFNEDIINTVNRFANLVSNDNEYMELVAQDKYRIYCHKKQNKIVLSKKLFKEHKAIVTRVIRNALYELKGNIYNLEATHIYDIINIQKSPTGKKINLPQEIVVSNNYGDIHIYNNINYKSFNGDTIKINIGEEYFIKNNNLYIYSDIENRNIGKDFKGNDFIKYFDYDKINGEIILRYRKEGDRFNPIGMKGTKKLKDIFMDLKIPKEERDSIPLICFGNDIAWIWGYRISEKFKVDKNTKQILKIQFKRGELI